MKKYKLSFLACFLAVVCLLAVGCGSKDTKTVKAPLVKTQQVGSGSLNDSSSYSGTVRGRYETNMSFQVSGQILSRNVQVGSPVRAGDVLMVIDSRDVVQKANQGAAQVASARANLDLAQRNLARYSQLYQENAVAAATLDQYQASYDSAFASYQNASSGSSSTFILLTLMSGCSSATWSTIGESMRQGPHQLAQKSIRTVPFASITSA